MSELAPIHVIGLGPTDYYAGPDVEDFFWVMTASGAGTVLDKFLAVYDLHVELCEDTSHAGLRLKLRPGRNESLTDEKVSAARERLAATKELLRPSAAGGGKRP